MNKLIISLKSPILSLKRELSLVIVINAYKQDN